MDDNSSASHDDVNKLLDQAETMIWAMLDGQLEEPQVRKLEQLLQDDPQVVARYLQCVQLESDLHAHFHPASRPSKAGAGSPPLTTFGLPALGDIGSFPPIVG